MLQRALLEERPIEVESVSGTDWHHYSYCWGAKAVQYENDQKAQAITSSLVRYISGLFLRGRAYAEPGKSICNVRSIFNNVLALMSVIEQFDPYVAMEPSGASGTAAVEPNSVFLSYSFSEDDRSLVDGLIRLLKQREYVVVAGERNPMGSLSRSIKDKIAKCAYFVVVMTCRDEKKNGRFTTSSWLLEEKGADDPPTGDRCHSFDDVHRVLCAFRSGYV